MVIEKRKGDVTISTVIFIVLGLVVLVMLIIGFTQGFDSLFGLFDKGPSELQQIASACELYAQGSLAIDFCNYREAGDELVNCNDPRIKTILTDKGVTYTNACAVGSTNLVAACGSIAPGKRNSTIVNSRGEFNCTKLS